MTKQSLSRPRGFFTRSRDAIAVRTRILSTLLETYALYGFDQMETPTIESLDTLSGSLPDTDRPNGGLILADLGEDPAGLRYDLTAPLARFCQEQGDALPKPFLRATAGMVWRNEKPSPSRSREFWQCDADCVGTDLSVFPSMLAMVSEGLTALNTPAFTIALNDRRLLDSLLDKAAIPDTQRLAVLHTLDKRDKVGLEGVAKLLTTGLEDTSGTFIDGLGLTTAQLTTIMACLSTSTPWMEIAESLNPALAAEWTLYITLMSSMNVPFTLDISIARGLSYYTGPVFEIIVTDPTLQDQAGGAIGAGGAYDLNKKLGRQPLPAFGVSVGCDRLARLLDTPPPSDPLVVVTSLMPDPVWEQAIAAQLRQAGIKALAYPGTIRNFTKRLKWADKVNAQLAVFRGEDEAQRGDIQIKNLLLGRQLAATLDKADWDKNPQQYQMPQSRLIDGVKAQLAANANPKSA